VTLSPYGQFSYTPFADYSGSDSFSYRLSDSYGGSAVGSASLLVRPVNDAPAAADDRYSTPEDTPLQLPFSGLLANDAEVHSPPPQPPGLAGGAPAPGSLTAAGGGLAYTPDADYSGSDGFSYPVGDGLATASAAVAITVTPVNDAPVAVADSFSTAEDLAL